MSDKRKTVQACADDLKAYLVNREVVEGLEPPSAVQSNIAQMDAVAIDSLAGATHALLNDEHKRVAVCTCSRAVVLEVVGGQHQSLYTGTCECKRRWHLEEVTIDFGPEEVTEQ